MNYDKYLPIMGIDWKFISITKWNAAKKQNLKWKEHEYGD